MLHWLSGPYILRTAQMMIFSLVAIIGLEKCCITSACLQWLCHSGERIVAMGLLFLLIFFIEACCGYLFELHRLVDAIQMGTHNICLYKEVDKKYTGCNLKTTELLDCALVGVCVVIRLNTVLREICTSTYQICRIEETINGTTTFNKWICNLKILWKRGEIAPYKQFLLFVTCC